MRRRHQTASMHMQIANRGCRKIKLQRLPTIAAIEGDIDAVLCAAVKQPLALAIFADDARNGVGGQTIDYFLPGFAGIAGAEYIWVSVGRCRGDEISGVGVGG